MGKTQWPMAALLAAGMLVAGCQREAAVHPPAARAPAARAAALPAAPPGAPNSERIINDAAPSGNAGPPFLIRVGRASDGRLTRVAWDLRGGRTTADVAWPKGGGDNDTFRMQGDFRFDLKMQDDEEFDGLVSGVETRRDDDTVESIEITSPPESTTDARRHVLSILSHIGGGNREIALLQAWYAKVKAGDFENLDITTITATSREMSVHVVNDGTSERPWSVGVDIDWTHTCGCHG